MNNLFRNNRNSKIAIVVFIILLFAFFAIKARAQETLDVEVGSAVLRGETPVLGLTMACRGCGPIYTDYEFGFDLIGESTHEIYNSNVIQVRGQIVDGWGRFEMGLGFYYQNVAQEYTCDFGFHLLARYRVVERLSVQWRHSSSASSCYPNAGRDLITVAWRF